MKTRHHGRGRVARHQTWQKEVDRQGRPERDKEEAEAAQDESHASSLNGDESFLVLFFKKEQRFFLKKEAKTSIRWNALTSHAGGAR
jgi:hypothetical protein